MRNLSRPKLKAIEIPMPGIAEREEILRQVCDLLAALSLREPMVHLLRRLDLLEQSILAEACRGELVPQDPNDEPAAMLLEGIRN